MSSPPVLSLMRFFLGGGPCPEDGRCSRSGPPFSGNKKETWVAVGRSASPLYTELSRDFPDIWVALRVDSGVPKILIKQSGLTERMYILLYKTNSNEFSKFYGSSGRSNGGVIPRGRRR